MLGGRFFERVTDNPPSRRPWYIAWVNRGTNINIVLLRRLRHCTEVEISKAVCLRCHTPQFVSLTPIAASSWRPPYRLYFGIFLLCNFHSNKESAICASSSDCCILRNDILPFEPNHRTRHPCVSATSLLCPRLLKKDGRHILLIHPPPSIPHRGQPSTPDRQSLSYHRRSHRHRLQARTNFLLCRRHRLHC